MKKNGILILALLPLLFAGFLVGFYIGRNVSPGDVQVSRVPSATVATTAPTAAPTVNPTQPGQTEVPSPTVPATLPGGKVNINTATKEQLMTLPGIGEVLAQKIIDYRAEHGPFKKIADLLLVDGIGEHRLDAIIDNITI